MRASGWAGQIRPTFRPDAVLDLAAPDWAASVQALGQAAGRVRQAARFAMLLPRELDPVAAASGAPLPLPRPTIMIRRYPLRPHTIASSKKLGSKSEPKLISAEVKPRGALYRQPR